MDDHRVGAVLWSSGSDNWRKEMADQERRRVGRTTPSSPGHELQWLSYESHWTLPAKQTTATEKPFLVVSAKAEAALAKKPQPRQKVGVHVGSVKDGMAATSKEPTSASILQSPGI
ncbi:hypothetical protein N7533_012915 [Penicillium manginii]|uniref:uncharacterized protein n=1 Tax=Penicillium manginii TaxID=203109 RepID=UPI0025491485|nr:uncharacterized protein N7533_012915 [Penicillium manginii]KAJ5734512.1 hypothetical protein N7533_012915 [Penicillium manginii]